MPLKCLQVCKSKSKELNLLKNSSHLLKDSQTITQSYLISIMFSPTSTTCFIFRTNRISFQIFNKWILKSSILRTFLKLNLSNIWPQIMQESSGLKSGYETDHSFGVNKCWHIFFQPGHCALGLVCWRRILLKIAMIFSKHFPDISL